MCTICSCGDFSFGSSFLSPFSRSASGDELRPQTPSTPPPLRTPPPEAPSHRRGNFTRNEYEMRRQLKIMDDLGKVLRQKPTTVRDVKKQRPKTVFHDDSALSRSPSKGFLGMTLSYSTLPHFLSFFRWVLGVIHHVKYDTLPLLPVGSRLNKVYSQSTMNLSSMANDTGSSGTLRVRKSPR